MKRREYTESRECIRNYWQDPTILYTNVGKITGATGQPLFYVFFKHFVLSGLSYFGENKAGGSEEGITVLPSLLVGT